MTAKASQPRFLSRDIDYLADLGGKLRDLQGFTTLANELIQNADDAQNADTIVFDVCEDALIVDNNGTFSDCGSTESDECPWKIMGGHRCDFHRFRHVASGDKRSQEGTTGAFGIGFIAVYQITDQPEFISSGHHWKIHEEESAEKRIEICGGCPRCQDPKLPKTRFILPWATDPHSILRNRLKSEAVAPDTPDKFFNEIKGSISRSMIFLKRLNYIELKRNTKRVQLIERILSNNELLINDEETHTFLLLSGAFQESAGLLKKRYANLIEPKRSDKVSIALPLDTSETGFLYATLPTQHESGLPFHINADFFPTNDRKGIIFEDDYQSEWNRAAIEAAAVVTKDKFSELPNQLGHIRLWNLLEILQKVAADSSKYPKKAVFAKFWELTKPVLKQAHIIYSTKKEWLIASDTYLLEKEEEEEAIPVLEKMNLNIVNIDLKSYQNLLRGPELGVLLLDINHITEKLTELGLNKQTPLNELPSYISTPEARHILFREIDLLLKRKRKEENQKIYEAETAGCALAQGFDNSLWPCREIFRADEETIRLFGGLDPNIPFINAETASYDFIARLCPNFDAESACNQLVNMSYELLTNAIKDILLGPMQLLSWFESRSTEIVNSPQLKAKLSALPIFPSHSGLSPLKDLVLPGGFEDPIGLTYVVDVQRINNRTQFLIDLGANQLSLLKYAETHIPIAFNDPDLNINKKRKAVMLLAKKFGEIADNPVIIKTLSDIKIIECSGGNFYKPRGTYFPNENILEILGKDTPTAVLPTENTESIKQLYRALGVCEQPRYEDIIKLIKKTVSKPPNLNSIKYIELLFRHLGERFKIEKPEQQLKELCSLEWLPAHGDTEKWYKPESIYTTFRDYLFKTQADFLNIHLTIQRSCSELINFLDIGSEPSVKQVVDHLIQSSISKVEVNNEVYGFLNDFLNKVNDTAYRDGRREIQRLIKKDCIYIPIIGYVKPSNVFWRKSNFGSYRYKLSDGLKQYRKIFDELKVKDEPDWEDAVAVMRDIEDKFGLNDNKLGDEDYKVVFACWDLIDCAFNTGQIDDIDNAQIKITNSGVIPDAMNHLQKPKQLYMEDRSGLAERIDRNKQSRIIKRYQSWRTMQRAGVKSLSKSIEYSIHDAANPISDSLLGNRFRERVSQIDRLLEGNRSISSLDMVERLEFQSVSRLLVSMALPDIHWYGEPENVTAHYTEHILYYLKENNNTPLASIAKELAIALFPGDDPGRFALGIKEILSAKTIQDAEKILDDLGFPPPITPTGGDIEGREIESIGGFSETSPDESNALGEGRQIHPTSEGNTADSVDKAVEAILGTDVVSPNPLPPGLDSATIPASPTNKATAVTKGRMVPSENRRRLISYVMHGGSQNAESSELIEKRTEVEIAGIERVVQWEKGAVPPRTPHVMPQNNPGYDIEAKDEFGRIVRYIEVKACSGKWDDMGVCLTKTEFEKAGDIGQNYWLYVVERAQHDDYCIHRIQDPARQVDAYFYDRGWRTIEEYDANINEISENMGITGEDSYNGEN